MNKDRWLHLIIPSLKSQRIVFNLKNRTIGYRIRNSRLFWQLECIETNSEDFSGWIYKKTFSNPEIIKEKSPKKSSYEVGAQYLKNF